MAGAATSASASSTRRRTPSSTRRVSAATPGAHHQLGVRSIRSGPRVKHDYFNPLPSANLTFDVQKNLLLRFSAAETMSRPDYSALGGTVTLTDLTLTGNGGNPNLKPITGGRLRRGGGVVLRADRGGGGQPLLRRPVVVRDVRQPHRGLRGPVPVQTRAAPGVQALCDLLAGQHHWHGEGHRDTGPTAAALRLRLPDQRNLHRRLRRQRQCVGRHLEGDLQRGGLLREPLVQCPPRLHLPLEILRRSRPRRGRDAGGLWRAGRIGELHRHQEHHDLASTR